MKELEIKLDHNIDLENKTWSLKAVHISNSVFEKQTFFEQQSLQEFFLIFQLIALDRIMSVCQKIRSPRSLEKVWKTLSS